MNSTLRIKTTGERLRGLVLLRVKEYDRNIERTNAALLAITAEYQRADENTKRQIDEMNLRLARPAGVVGRHDEYESVGFSKALSAKAQIDKLSNTVAVLTNYRQQAQWLADVIDPSAAYELSGDDLVVIGIGAGVGAGFRGGVFDPLDA
jgi:hypothetical protein